eukprot:2832335-Rhodomonas_salina.1
MVPRALCDRDVWLVGNDEPLGWGQSVQEKKSGTVHTHNCVALKDRSRLTIASLREYALSKVPDHIWFHCQAQMSSNYSRAAQRLVLTWRIVQPGAVGVVSTLKTAATMRKGER